MRLKKEPKCKVLKNGIIGCRVKLPNGGEVKQIYKASPECIGIVTKNFIETKVKPKIIEQRKMGNRIGKTSAWLSEKTLTCRNKYTFKDQGKVRILEKTSECIEDKMRWEKGADRLKDILHTI